MSTEVRASLPNATDIPFLPSHLPDITIITPVFDEKSREIIFFTASRGHHADIGGILPGSMASFVYPFNQLHIDRYYFIQPPTSVNIFEEGAEIVSHKIVDGGVFQRDALWELMVERPAKYPGSSGCRNFKDVESDLKAVSTRDRCHHRGSDGKGCSKSRPITKE